MPEDSVLELDLKYGDVSDEEDRIAEAGAPFGGKHILYFPDRHPLQTEESSWAGNHIKHIPEAPPELHFITREFPTRYENGEVAYLEEIRQKIFVAMQQ